MILITGAAGKTGRAIIRALSAGGEAVRALVQERGIDIPETTRFVAGLHNTTTDDIEFYFVDVVGNEDLTPSVNSRTASSAESPSPRMPISMRPWRAIFAAVPVTYR